MPTAVEYAVMLSLIIVACLEEISLVGKQAAGTFRQAGKKIGQGAVTRHCSGLPHIASDVGLRLGKTSSQAKGVIIGSAQSTGWQVHLERGHTFIAIGLPLATVQKYRNLARARALSTDPSFRQLRAPVGMAARIYVLGASNELIPAV